VEIYCSEFQALESPGKRHTAGPGKSWKVLELLTRSSGISSFGLSSPKRLNR